MIKNCNQGFALFPILALIFIAMRLRAQFQLNASQQGWVKATMAQMSEDEKVGQLLCAVATAIFTNVESDEFKAIQDNIQKYHVGCYHLEGFMGGDPLTGAMMVEHMQQTAKLPLFITADFEGGVGIQFRGGTRFPRGMAIGATGNTQYAYDAAHFTAEEAKAMGVNVNFYPVVDVNNNPRNPVINIRSFGEDPQRVSAFAEAYVKGTQDTGIIATAKHFPGHGDTSVDSHLQLPVLNFDRARLNLIELPPFEAAIKAGVGAIMTAHIDLPQLEKTPGLPASLSYSITTGLLRQQLGFKGLVFTDALRMKAVSDTFGPEQAAVMAIHAGADVALEPTDIPKSYEALKEAVSKGEISQPRLDESVQRILEAKAWAGLNQHALPDITQVDKRVGSPAAAQKSQEIMEHALTLVKDDHNALPLKLSPDEDVLLLSFVDAPNIEFTNEPGVTFRREFVKRHAKTLYATVGPDISPGESSLIEQLADRYRTVVISCTIRFASARGFIGLAERQQALLKTLAGHQGPLVFALFGSPYLLDDIPELPSYALAFEYYPGAEAAMV
ncbi:MAG: glycoside hydrolase family 3 N-terminal domain-containing protein, partial [Terriglobia bacterium]